MCGINFLLCKTDRQDKRVIRLMSESIRYRGPDHTGFYTLQSEGATLFFGANRLRIVDNDSGSDQPMISPDGNDVLVFNGEIYNHAELKKTLSGGNYRFLTNSDTEVLMYYLKEKGRDGIKDLQGMFAFVYFNRQTGEVLAARDRHGMKPLFYHDTPDMVMISSEVNGILGSGMVKKLISREKVREYLWYRYITPPGTFFRNISQLSPGQYISYKSGVGMSISEFQQQTTVSDFIIGEKVTALSEKILVESLDKHLRSFKTPGLMLSGGVDSALLLVLSEKYKLPLELAFTVAVKDPTLKGSSNDLQHSMWLAEKIPKLTHEIIPVGENIMEEIPGFLEGMDQPVGDMAWILTDLLCRRAGLKTNVLISGAGADEYFAGYNRHVAFSFYLKHPYLVNLLRKGRSGKVVQFLNWIYTILKRDSRLMNRFIFNLEKDPATTFDHFISTGMGDQTEIPITKTKASFSGNIEDWLSWALERDRKEYLVNDVLHLTDQVAMRNSIEVRMPYLDNQLTDFVRRINPQIHLRRNGKFILKSILDRHGWNKISNRKKEGFGFPFGTWIRNKKHQPLLSGLYDKNNGIFEYIDYRTTRDMLGKHMSGKQDAGLQIFTLLALSGWMKRM